MGLSDQLQKLITEHGSAAILRDHLALFKDQLTMADKKISMLESENAILKDGNAQLKLETQNLRIASNDHTDHTDLSHHKTRIFDFSGENSESEQHLLKSLSGAKRRIFVFGLTRNFYADDKIQKILIKKSSEIPIYIFMIDPDCFSKRDRYRLEPSRAAYKNAAYFKEKVETTFRKILARCTNINPGSRDPGICFMYYNFPCSFAMEQIDDEIRVFLYGYGKRGTDSPTFVFSRDESL